MVELSAQFSRLKGEFLKHLKKTSSSVRHKLDTSPHVFMPDKIML